MRLKTIVVPEVLRDKWLLIRILVDSEARVELEWFCV